MVKQRALQVLVWRKEPVRGGVTKTKSLWNHQQLVMWDYLLPLFDCLFLGLLRFSISNFIFQLNNKLTWSGVAPPVLL
jgi:hypothetical protein